MTSVVADSAPFIKMLGETLVSASGEIPTAKALEGKECVMFYFSAHWCPPCKMFTPQLANHYKTLKEKNKAVEVIFVSSDRDEDAFNEYFAEMPWLALPFSARELKAKLSSKFKVSGIPTLCLLDASGNCYSTNGRSAVQDLDAYPWIPRTVPELLGDELNAKVQGKTYGIYFSAHWCGPCRGFTPQLVERYKALRDAGKDFEIIFASSDRDEAAFNEYFAEMPWLALPFDKRKEKNELSERFEVRGIPTLVIIGEDGKTITTAGRGAIGADTFLEDFPYHPKPVNDLDVVTDGINDEPSVVLLCQNADDATKAAIDEALAQVAKRVFALPEDDRPVGRFFTAKGAMCGRVCGMTNLSPNETRLIILNIPSNGAFYVAEAKEGAPSAADIDEFIANFKDGKLERNQLG